MECYIRIIKKTIHYMYNYISGKLVEATPSYAVVDNNGIGYLIEISLNTFTQIKDLAEVRLLIHYVV
ncbi:MAG: hypothetical protein IJ269_06070, partial [Bacteroidales bacterium]|nr:hypothetical protein [Bacteroidales bacterium]